SITKTLIVSSAESINIFDSNFTDCSETPLFSLRYSAQLMGTIAAQKPQASKQRGQGNDVSYPRSFLADDPYPVDSDRRQAAGRGVRHGRGGGEGCVELLQPQSRNLRQGPGRHRCVHAEGRVRRAY